MLIAWVVLVLTLGWTYWYALDQLVRAWIRLPDYQHGFVVPLFAAFLLWVRQDMVNPWPKRGSWWAVPFFVVWPLIRFMNVWLHYDRDVDSIFPFLFGLTLFLGGWRALRWAWPSIIFLVFMVPLPASVSIMLSRPLQRIATIASAYSLQTLGISAIVPGDQGNVIQLPSPCPPLGVDRACSGLSMLTLFFAICIGAAFLLRIRLWEKIVIVISAVPIAVLSNVGRITGTGVLDVFINPTIGQGFHDYAGWLMMIFAMLMIWGEMTLFSNLLIETRLDRPLAIDGTLMPGMAGIAGGRPGMRRPPDRRPGGAR